MLFYLERRRRMIVRNFDRITVDRRFFDEGTKENETR